MDTLVRDEGITSFVVHGVSGRLHGGRRHDLPRAAADGRNGGLVHARRERRRHRPARRKRCRGEGAEYHALTRPPAPKGGPRSGDRSEMAGVPIYIVHCRRPTRCRRSAGARYGSARLRGNVPAVSVLVADNYEEPGFDANYVMSPLRENGTRRAVEGSRRTTCGHTTDHCPFCMAGQRAGQDDFSKIPNGAPGVRRGSRSSTTAASVRGASSEPLRRACRRRLANVRPFRAGTIAVGSDADIVVFDRRRQTLASSRCTCAWTTTHTRAQPPGRAVVRRRAGERDHQGTRSSKEGRGPLHQARPQPRAKGIVTESHR